MIYNQNLTLQGYGVTLHRLTHDKIELVRQWRNDPKISQYMFFKDYITPEMQEAWFQKINNDNNFYFIIEYEGKEIGLINIKDIDCEKKCGETGVFVYDDLYLNSDIAYRAHLLIFDFIYIDIRLQYTFSHITRDNIRAQRFASFLGGTVVLTDEHGVKYSITADDYLSNTNREHFLRRWTRYKKSNI